MTAQQADLKRLYDKLLDELALRSEYKITTDDRARYLELVDRYGYRACVNATFDLIDSDEQLVVMPSVMEIERKIVRPLELHN